MADAKLAEARNFDLDTSGGADPWEGSAIAIAASGGAIPVGGILETGTGAFAALAVGGGTPHDAVDSGSPLKIGGKATTALPAPVANDDRVNAAFTPEGALQVATTIGNVKTYERTITGTGVDITLPVGGATSITLIVTGTFVATAVLQGSWDGGVDAAAWDNMRPQQTDADPSPNYSWTSTTTRQYFGLGRFSHVRLNCTAYTSGTMTVRFIVQTAAVDGVVSVWDDGMQDGHWYPVRLNPNRAQVVAPLTGISAGSLGDNVSTASAFYSGDSSKMLAGVGGFVYDGSNWDRARGIGIGDGVAATGIAAAGLMAYNGATYDRLTLENLTNAKALNVAIVDGNGDQLTSFGGGTQYTEGDTDATITGTAVMWEDTSDTLVAVSASKPLPVDITDSTVAVIGNVAHDAADTGNPVKIGGYASATVPLAVGNGDRVNAWYSPRGRQGVFMGGASTGGGGDGEGNAFVYAMGSDETSGMLPGALWVYNGATYDRLRLAPSADGQDRTGLLASSLMGYNGSTWDRVRVANTGRLQVDVVTGGGGGTQYTEGDTDATIAGTAILWEDAGDTLTPVSSSKPLPISLGAAIPAGTNNIGDVDVLTVPAPLSTTGGGTEATALRVTVANDSTGVLSVDDNGSSLTVDGTVAATQSGTWTVQPGNTQNTTPWLAAIHDGSNLATVRNLAANDALNVAIVDGSGAHITSFGGGTQYTEGDTDASITGTAMLWEDGSDTLRAVSVAKPLPVAPLGDVAHDATDSGNPLKIGGRAKDALANVAAGDRTDAWFGLSGHAMVGLLSEGTGTGGDTAALARLLDPTGPSTNPIPTAAFGYNPTAGAFERLRTATGITTVATNVRETGVLAAGLGPGFTRRHSDTITSNGDAVTFDTGGVGSVFIEITGTWVATLIFEYSLDGGTTWYTAQAMMTVSSGVDTWVGAAGTTAANGRFRHHFVGGITKFRVRASAYTSGTATVVINGEATGTGQKAIEVGPAPHNYGFAETSVTAQYTATQTSTTLGPTISASQRMVVTYFQIDWDGSVEGAIQLYFGTGAYSRGTNKALYDGGGHPTSTARGGVIQSKPNGWMGAADEELKVTTSAAINPLTVTVWYYIVTV